MKNKCTYFFLFISLYVILTSNEVYAQKLHIDLLWNTKLDTLPLIKAGETIVTLSLKENGVHRNENHFIPHYCKEIPESRGGNVQARITNPVYTAYSGPELDLFKHLSTECTVTSGSIYYKKKPSLFIDIESVRRNKITNQVELLTSCDIEYTIQPILSSRSGESRDFASNSVLASGTWYKISIPTSGVYKIDYTFLVNQCKIPASALQFATLGIFGRGGAMLPEKVGDARVDDLKELSFHRYDQNGNGKLESGDYLLLYAEGPIVWNYDSLNNRFVHHKNLYDTKTYYYITTDKGSGKSFSDQASTSGGTDITTFDDYAVFEDDRNNFIKSGRMWFGEKMSTVNSSLSYSFTFPNYASDAPLKIRSIAAARSILASTSLNLQINGTSAFTHSIGTVGADYTDFYANVSEQNASLSMSSDNINAVYTHSNPDNSAASWLDFIELNARRRLQFTGAFMMFRNSTNISASAISRFVISNAPSTLEVWDISNLFEARKQLGTVSGSTFSFSLSTPLIREFVAVDIANTSSLPSPSFVENVANQNYHSLATQNPDMVIVVSEELYSYAEVIAEFHRSKNSLSVVTLKAPLLYNEFAGGTPDPTAIRDFMKMLYEAAGSNPDKLPQYLLLYGDASFDPQFGRTQSLQTLIPTYESFNSTSPIISYCTDDFFACLDDNEGADMSENINFMDVSVGRLVVRNATEANGVNQKILQYKQPSSQGSWRNWVTFVADDKDGNTHIGDANTVAENIAARYPAYNIDKIYLDAYRIQSTPAGNRYPDVNNAIQNKLFQGTLIMSWVGHGGVQNWAHERIFDVSDIEGLANKDRLPLFFTATCDFSKFDEEGISTAGEKLLLNSNGGGIALVTTVRLVFAYSNMLLNNAFFNKVFEPYNGRKPTIGELVMVTKNSMTDAVNTRKFTLLGDPALTLNYPEYNVVTTKINEVPISGAVDTLKALKKITIKGEVRNSSNIKLSSFNGEVFPTVFDKKQRIITLGNDGNVPFAFFLQKNAVFKGKASVKNGEFTFTFIVPKDIDYSIGKAKISYYAADGTIDAHGYNNEAYVGGLADTFAIDNAGPDASIYMNDEKFVFGGTTDENPILLLKLFDENGINTSGTGIGHEITGILDANDKNKIYLNDFYEGELDNYQKGTVRYPFHNLSEGKHNIEVKVWDTYNNSSKAYTEFIVAKNPKVALQHVMNYPNPFTTHTQFMFEHNKPGQELDVLIQIFSASGKIVKTIHETRVTEGYRVDDIAWDGLDEYGDKIGRGVYIYKINIRSAEGSAQQFEKLVVLQ